MITKHKLTLTVQHPTITPLQSKRCYLPQSHHHHQYHHRIATPPLPYLLLINFFYFLFLNPNYYYSSFSFLFIYSKPHSPLSLSLTSHMEEEQEQQHLLSICCGTNNPVLRGPTVRTLPFTRLVSSDDGDGCAYSRPVLVLDMVWNLAFVVVAAGVLLSTLRERPSTPLRLWLCGYAVECLLHMAFVYSEYRSATTTRDYSFSHSPYSIVKKLEPMNTLVSSVWWVFGFYWIVAGGQALLEDSPRLYWLTVVFLAFDVFFIIFCVGMACIIFFALFCIIPIIALAYALRIREGASEEDIRSLPKYRFSQSNVLVMVDDKKQLVKARTDSCNGTHISELSLHPDDSECCICLCPYVDGTELYRLPCTHHFHCGCISRWLRTKATCPLCKFNILRGGDTMV